MGLFIGYCARAFHPDTVHWGARWARATQTRLPPASDGSTQGTTGKVSLSGRRTTVRGEHRTTQAFGGPWTILKLATLERYLAAYGKVFARQPHRLVYIDAFAGDAHVTVGTDEKTQQMEWWPQPGRREISGSAEIAFRQARIDSFLFIELKRRHAENIRKLAESRKNPAAVVQVRTGDCNPILPEFLATFDPANSRGLAFLDPFGMQLTWDTLSTVAGVPGLDVWYWFSLEGVLRQAPRSRVKMTPDKQGSLERILAPTVWQRLYRSTPTLFADQGYEPSAQRVLWPEVVRVVTSELRTLFAEVLEPRIFYDKNTPRFALYFAMTNPHPRARKIATDIAGHLLKHSLSPSKT